MHFFNKIYKKSHDWFLEQSCSELVQARNRLADELHRDMAGKQIPHIDGTLLPQLGRKWWTGTKPQEKEASLRNQTINCLEEKTKYYHHPDGLLRYWVWWENSNITSEQAIPKVSTLFLFLLIWKRIQNTQLAATLYCTSFAGRFHCRDQCDRQGIYGSCYSLQK